MNLHLRLLIGYHALVGLLLLLAAGAALGFHQQKEALQQSKESATRQVGLLSHLEGHDRLASRAPDGDGRSELEKSLVDLESQLAAAAETSQRYASIYAALLVLVLITVAFLSRQLRRGLVDRMVQIATVAQAVADGDRSRRVNSGPDDELGIIGRQMNALLDKEQALHAEMDGRLCQQRQLLLGMIHLWPKKVALFTIYGDLAVSALEERDREELEAAEIAFPDPPALARDDRPFNPKVGKRELHCRLLRVDGRRPVGWLAELD